MSLHELITVVHAYHATLTTRSLVTFSEQAREYDANEVGDINRLRLLAFILQAKTGCERMVVPCVSCNKSEKLHSALSCQKVGCSGLCEERKSTGIPCVSCVKPIPLGDVCLLCPTCSWVSCQDCYQVASHPHILNLKFLFI